MTDSHPYNAITLYIHFRVDRAQRGSTLMIVPGDFTFLVLLYLPKRQVARLGAIGEVYFSLAREAQEFEFAFEI